MDHVHCHINQWLLGRGKFRQQDLTDGTREICQKVPRHELVLVNGLEKSIMTHGMVLHTRKDEGLGADETNTKHILCTPEVPPNGYEAAEQEAELQLIQESCTSPNQLPPRTRCQ